jgi:hypothetical protein
MYYTVLFNEKPSQCGRFQDFDFGMKDSFIKLGVIVF